MPVLHNNRIGIGKVSKLDQDIRNYIGQYKREEYDQAIANDDRWEVFFHLSDLRQSLLSWYEFKPNAAVLEIGGGFGALTGVLCDRCARVVTTERSLFRAEAICERYSDQENLVVHACDMWDLELEEKFDYIVAVGLLERAANGKKSQTRYIEYLQKLMTLLNPCGKILLAVDNRYGVKYFCGAAAPYTNRPFDGINQYPQGGRGYVFNKKEIINILHLAGLHFHKFYYPLPDYKFPQLIYSENHLPKKNIRERLIPYYPNPNTLLISENDLYDDLIENRVFEFFANSFFLECSLENIFCPIQFAAISADRGRENSFITAIYARNTVRKKALFQNGKDNLKKLYAHIAELKKRGLKVVAHTWDKEELVLPFIEGDTLSNYLKELVKTESDKFISIFDRLYSLILQSSDSVENEKNALFTDETKCLNWGVILKRAFIELIPLNSFYVNEEIIFFDQEFVRENYPAKYILFRAIHYTYIFAPHAKNFVPIENLKERYDLLDVWDLFLAEENRFLFDIRNHQMYRQFYKWATVSPKTLQKNAGLLGSDDEIMADYKVSSDMKAIWNVQLDMLEKLKQVCSKYNLKFFMIYGTLLGAVRHHGFIPWDDDVDIAMPRLDFERLSTIAKQEFQHPYFLQTMENDRECFYGGYARLRNSNTTGLSQRDFWNHSNQGIWIDILPLDSTNRKPEILGTRINRIFKAQNLLFSKIYGINFIKGQGRFFKLKQYYYYLKSRVLSHETLCKRLKNEFLGESPETDAYYVILAHHGSCMVFDKRDFISSVEMDFAHLKLPAPKGYKRCLEMSVGKNYMEYPPMEKRKPHHDVIFNTTLSYRVYRELFLNMFEGVENKTIVLFGSGFMFDDYMKKYGRKYKPVFVVDNDESKWNTEKKGIPVKPPNALNSVSRQKLHLIICSFYYKSIEKGLRNMGITRYKIYVQNRNWIWDDEIKGRGDIEKI